MNTRMAFEALNSLSLAFAELAEAMMQPESERDQSMGSTQPATTAPAAAPAGTASPPGGSPSELSPFEEVTWEPPDTLSVTVDSGSLANCPKHHSAYLPSKFKEGAFYCPADSDDSAWRNSKGKCRITPANAAEWLRVTAAA